MVIVHGIINFLNQFIRHYIMNRFLSALIIFLLPDGVATCTFVRLANVLDLLWGSDREDYQSNQVAVAF